MNICPPAWVSPPLLSAITADTEELIQGNWMLPESSYQRFLKMFVVSGELFIVSLLPTTQGQTREQSWQWHWSKTGVVIEAGGYDSYLINLDGSPEDDLSSPKLHISIPQYVFLGDETLLTSRSTLQQSVSQSVSQSVWVCEPLLGEVSYITLWVHQVSQNPYQDNHVLHNSNSGA